MSETLIHPIAEIFPKCYAYSLPGIPYKVGMLKIGTTMEKDAVQRIWDQLRTANLRFTTEWIREAVFLDKDGNKTLPFRDDPFHHYLERLGIRRDRWDPPQKGKQPEWFFISPEDAERHFDDFQKNHGIITADGQAEKYTLRKEQDDAVSKAKTFFALHPRGEFLWNAKPRFGKTLAAYDLCKQMRSESGQPFHVLIATNRPTIANSWYEDYEKFMREESGFLFVVSTPSLTKTKSRRKLRHALTYDEYCEMVNSGSTHADSRFEFVSLQYLKRSGDSDTLKHIMTTDWGMLIVDEAHEGVDTVKTEDAFEQITRKSTLHLSGTPFRAIARNAFPDDRRFDWTYAEEQAEKKAWNNPDSENPYEDLPTLNLFTYRMSDIVRSQIFDRALDLNEFFSVKGGRFVYEAAVDAFLDALTTQTKFPYSTEELRGELCHTIWILNRVESVKALQKKLNAHPVFSEYHIVPAVGSATKDEDENKVSSYIAVTDAIKKYPKTITLSVRQLTVGVTIPQWTAVLMLNNGSSPSQYIQAAFRVQSPYIYLRGEVFLRKENAYIFDFDPARALSVFDKYSSDLSSDSIGDTARKEKLLQMLNFFPVLAEDKDGEMAKLDAEEIVRIIYNAHSQAIVDRGFKMPFLFKGLSLFSKADSSIQDIIEKLSAKKASSGKKDQVGIGGDSGKSNPKQYGSDPSRDGKTQQTEKHDDKKKDPEDELRDKLELLSSKIPALLMAYGKAGTNLVSFRDDIPEKTFLKVTGITMEEFYTLQTSDFGFEPTELDAAIKTFMLKKQELSGILCESEYDIIDFIPDLSSNQIFTPKAIVKQMVDAMEKETPGCFDDPDKTFIDPYMKSGRFIAEIVKRLYKSKTMEHIIPDENARLQYIFEKQVYGLAPSEILYQISIQYLNGFGIDLYQINHNFKVFDATESVKKGTLSFDLDRMFGK